MTRIVPAFVGITTIVPAIDRNPPSPLYLSRGNDKPFKSVTRGWHYFVTSDTKNPLLKIPISLPISSVSHRTIPRNEVPIRGLIFSTPRDKSRGQRENEKIVPLANILALRAPFRG